MHAKLIQSGNLIEIFRFQYDPKPNRTSQKERAIERHYNISIKKPRVYRKHSAHRRRDNVHRLKASFLRLVTANISRPEPLQLATFTFVSMVDFQQGYKEWRSFIQRLRKIYGQEFAYIAVAEYQERGSLHFHALMWGLPYDLGDNYKRIPVRSKITTSRSVSQRYVYKLFKRGKERAYHPLQKLWGFGFVDIRQTDGSPALAAYLAKYLVKSQFDNRTFGEKAYVTSRNIHRPRVITGPSNVDVASEVLDLSPLTCQYQDSFDTIYLGKCHYQKHLVNIQNNETNGNSISRLQNGNIEDW